MSAPARIWTAGHGSRSVEELLTLLREAGIECLVDVRAYPASRRHPQFAREALERSAAQAGIRYAWEGKALGGRRKPAGDSPHVALRSAAFRAYADHMVTEEFRGGVERLTAQSREARVAIMCAERLPWACHRFLISDYLAARGTGVIHLIGAGPGREHRLHEAARVAGGVLVYDRATQPDPGL